MKEIRPVHQLGSTRIQEAGRIRMGVKTAKAMKSIDTWRFTSPDQQSIETLAEMHGGTAKPWHEPRARTPDQWEVITTSNSIPVLLPPGGLSIWYEEWTGGGCARRCDGVTVEVPSNDPNESVEEMACLCKAANKMTCRPYSRLSLVLPGLPFQGVWRLETKGWNAAEELPAMENLINELQQGDARIIPANLQLEKRKQVKNGKTRNFVVPRIVLTNTFEELGLEPGQVVEPMTLEPTEERMALPQGGPPPPKEEDLFDDVDEIAEAEIVEEPVNMADRPHMRLAIKARLLAEGLEDVDGEELRHGICLGVTEGRTNSSKELTPDELKIALIFCDDIEGDRIEVKGKYKNGRIKIKRHP